MVLILDAAPDGVPSHLQCSQCQQHWHHDDPEYSLESFVRIHLRKGNRYRYVKAFPSGVVN